MVDILAGIINFLKADSGVSALVGTRVYGMELPDNEGDSDVMPRKTLVVRLAGGTPLHGGYAKVSTQNMECVSYGETPYECEKLRRAVFDALRELNNYENSNILINRVTELTGSTFGRDRDIDYPFCLQIFEVLFQETATT